MSRLAVFTTCNKPRCMFMSDEPQQSTRSRCGRKWKRGGLEPQTPMRPWCFLSELWCGVAPLPCNLPPVGARMAAGLCIPPPCPARHMKAPATAVLDVEGKWAPDGRVCCVHVSVRVPCHIRECFYCTSGLTHISLGRCGEGYRKSGEVVWASPDVHFLHRLLSVEQLDPEDQA